MTETATEPIVLADVNVDRQRNDTVAPCGCMVVAFRGRCALSVPCDEHAGKMVFIALPADLWSKVLADHAAALAKEQGT